MQKRRKERIFLKRRKNSITVLVAQVKNLNLDLMSMDLEVKLERLYIL